MEWSEATLVIDGDDEVPIEDVEMSVEVDEQMTIPRGADVEYSGSMEIEVDTQEVECPTCEAVNHLPSGMFLKMFTEEPVGCWLCGYSLL